MGGWGPNEELVPMKVGGRSSHPRPTSEPSWGFEKKSKLKWSEETPSKKLSRNLVSVSSRMAGPGAGAVGEGNG
jgi:hypothetical protein